MRKIIVVLLCCFFQDLAAQNFKASLIPDSLKENADAVKRSEELHIIIKGIDKAVVKRKYAITILNENGDNFAFYANSYTNYISLSDISGHLYDAEGKVLKSVKKKDIADVSAGDDVTLLTDSRAKKYSFFNRVYPYTVEFEDEQEYKGIFYLPIWDPVEDDRFAVQQSRMIVEVPEGYELRYQQFNVGAPPGIAANGPVKTYTWEIKDLKALQYESFQPDIQEIKPLVYIAPSAFSKWNYKGNMATWKGLGEFVAELNKDRDVLPENVKKDIHQLTDNIADRTQKIKALYKYMQGNTRYISIQLGIGGWQPFEAKYVAEKKYGDCKALSNYMVGILKEAGIKAYYVLVNSGRGKKGLNENFPAPYFNHAICCVPNGKDSIWLECTSQTEPAGFMGSFTGDRKALLIGDDGGYVVNTPSYRIEDNQQLRKIKAVIDDQGNMSAEVSTHFTGIQQELQHSLIYESTKEQREKYLNRALSLPTYVVEKSAYTEIPDIIPSVDEFLQVKASNYATVSGKRMFIVPNLFNRSTLKLEDKERKYPIRFSMAYQDADTAVFLVPAGYTVEARPKDLNIENQFGKYSITYRINKNNIEVIRYESINRMTYPASAYAELVKYFDAIYKADHNRIVLVKSE